MAIVDQNKQYKGSDLGLVWAFVKPAMYIGVFYLAISIGFKSAKTIDGLICPYFVWLSVGLISWFYMRDMILAGARSFTKYKYIVARTNYPSITLPTVVATSNIIIHLVLVVAVLIMSVFFGCMPSVYWLQLPVYIALSYVFSIFWGITTGLLSVVTKDFYNLLQSISMAIFWLSAILFDVNGIDNPVVRTVFLFNPVTFIVEGYRNAVCRHIWFFEQPKEMVCYLAVLGVLVLISLALYKKIGKVLTDII